MLSNTEDGTDHVYHLSGAAEKPLALEHIVLKGHVRERYVHSKYSQTCLKRPSIQVTCKSL